jgi:hypothetical protein
MEAAGKRADEIHASQGRRGRNRLSPVLACGAVQVIRFAVFGSWRDHIRGINRFLGYEKTNPLANSVFIT